MKIVTYKEWRSATVAVHGVNDMVKAVDEFMTRPDNVGNLMFEFAIRDDGEPLMRLTEAGRKAAPRFFGH